MLLHCSFLLRRAKKSNGSFLLDSQTSSFITSFLTVEDPVFSTSRRKLSCSIFFIKETHTCKSNFNKIIFQILTCALDIPLAAVCLIHFLTAVVCVNKLKFMLFLVDEESLVSETRNLSTFLSFLSLSGWFVQSFNFLEIGVNQPLEEFFKIRLKQEHKETH